ncbi:MAG: VCBS repeat-containing protein [Saprospiraceae bacterium]|nr:VCBS repeat-containing protein [Saprospiraceae bacterium]
MQKGRFIAGVIFFFHLALFAQDFVPLKYNNDLKVDLGVGLWAWPLPMDFDRDGDLDLIISCPDVPYNGIYYFENTSGNGTYPIFEKGKWLAPARRNLQVSQINDLSYVMGPGVEFRDFPDSLFKNPEIIFDKSILESRHEKIRFSQWKFVDFEGDGDLDLLAGIDDWVDYGWDNAFDKNGKWINGPLHGYVYLIENRDGTYVENGKVMAGNDPLDVFGAPSPNMADFDGDGDLDLICGEFLDRFTWFENKGTRQKPVYRAGRFLENEEGVIKMDLEMITPSAVDWGADGDMDLIVGDEDGRVALIENTGEVKENMPVFNSPVYFQQKADLVKFGALITPYSVDWDDDGDQDLICGNTAGYIGFIENLDGGNPPQWGRPVRLKADGEIIRIMAGENGSIQGPAEQKWGYTTLSVADWDGDGLKDIIVNSIWGRIDWFKNTGRQGLPVLSAQGPVKVDWPGVAPKPEWNWWDPSAQMLAPQWRTTPYAIDWNQDGLMDLIMLDHEGFLTFYERTWKNEALVLTTGKRIFFGTGGSRFNRRNEVVDSVYGPLQLNTDKYGSSGRRKWCFVDWDQDQDLDIIINGINAAWFENVRQNEGRVDYEFRGNLSEQKLAGHTTSPTTVDWNQDGIPELLLGAEDGHLYYFSKN